MTKKQLEDRITALEEEIKELRAQLLTLALRPVVSNPVPVVLPQPNIVPTPQWPPYTPYIGDAPPGWSPTITCSQTNQNRQVAVSSIRS